MTRPVLVFAAALGLAACNETSGADGGDVCHSESQSCATASDCCEGFACPAGSCVFVSGGNGSNGGGQTGGSTGSTGHTASTGGAASAGSGSTSGGSATTSGGTTGAGPSSSGGSSNGGSGSAGEPYTEVVVFATAATGTTTLHDGEADFAATSPVSPCSGGTQVGSCCYQPSTSGSPLTLVSAGTLTFADGAATLGVATYPGDVAYALESTTTPGFTWNPGDTLIVSAAGATVDGFTGSVTAPGAIAGLSPALSTGSPISITRAAGWSLSWTPDTQGGETMNVTLSDSAASGQIDCSVADTAGTLSVPAALLSNFQASDVAFVLAVRAAGTSADSGNAEVSILASVEVEGEATLE